MATIDVELLEESQTRYLTYALSVVNSRALPDVRDGLKPVQRRILYAMLNNLNLTPQHHHRKSAAVVGEVLARYHPHGDAACYEAMVRMAQPFSYRYPLVDGQGNFGSLDGDGAAAYRYTEARLTAFALEVLGDIGEETVPERPNFDQTVQEPIVLPCRVPNLLVNGVSGIAVGMATSIPPHNLREVCKALQLLVEDPEVSDAKLIAAVRAPDFPTGCLILNTAAELKSIYTTGRGAIRMRAEHKLESGARGKQSIVFISVPFATDKSMIVEKIADLIIQKKLPMLVDVRDESTSEVRIVLELAPSADAEKVLGYLFKNTPLQTNFNVNLTALIPGSQPGTNRPVLLQLRQLLEEFVKFRFEVTRAKLSFEKRKLEERIHLLEGLVKIADIIKEVIELVRKSDGRADAARRLQEKYKLSELQAYFIVDLRIYQLSRTSIEEVQAELEAKQARVNEIDKILKSDKAQRKLLNDDFERIAETYGDARRSKIIGSFEEAVVDAEEFLQHEDVYAVITKDGWMKRIRVTNDPLGTRVREGDSLFFVKPCSTKDSLAIVTNFGNLFVTKAYELASTSGFGEPVQKMFKFQDGEAIVSAFITPAGDAAVEEELLFAASSGVGFRAKCDLRTETKRSGKRLMKVSGDDRLRSCVRVRAPLVLCMSRDGYAECFELKEVPVLSGAGKGVILQKSSRGDELVYALSVKKGEVVRFELSKGEPKEVSVSGIEIGPRARRGEKAIARNTPVVGVPAEIDVVTKEVH